jgi:3-methylcrotonyl-CoA carboxylase alpha subunit
VRVDAGVTSGSDVTHYYDPMLAKLIAFGDDRSSAIARLERLLEECSVGGVRTNLPLLLWIARDAAFRAGETTTRFLAERLDESIFSNAPPPEAAVLVCAGALLLDGRAPWRVADAGIPLRLRHGDGVVELSADATEVPGVWRIAGDRSGELRAERHGAIVQAYYNGAAMAGAVTYAGDEFIVHVDGRAWTFAFAAPPSTDGAGGSQAAASGAHVAAPMPGKIVKIAVREGDNVDEHALLVVLEAMKMEHRIEAPAAAIVKSVRVKEGQVVSAGTPLVTLGPSTTLRTGSVEK